MIKRNGNYSVCEGIGGCGVVAKPPHHTPTLQLQGCLTLYRLKDDLVFRGIDLFWFWFIVLFHHFFYNLKILLCS